MFKRSSFDMVAVAYENTIDWKARLSNEIPMLLKQLNRTRGNRVLDLACGTGRHAVALAHAGARVVGIDNSREMIRAAKQNARKEGVDVIFIHADMQELSHLDIGNFDMIICLGNSLALLPSLDALGSVMRSIENRLSSLGVFVFQVINSAMATRPEIDTLPIKTAVLNSERMVFVRFFDNSYRVQGSSVLVLCALISKNGIWRTALTTHSVLELRRETVLSYLHDARLTYHEVYSDFNNTTFHPETDRNIVVIARRTEDNEY